MQKNVLLKMKQKMRVSPFREKDLFYIIDESSSLEDPAGKFFSLKGNLSFGFHRLRVVSLVGFI